MYINVGTPKDPQKVPRGSFFAPPRGLGEGLE